MEVSFFLENAFVNLVTPESRHALVKPLYDNEL